MKLSRREALTVVTAAGVTALVGARPAEGDTVTIDASHLPPAYRGDHQPKALPFDPAKLRGLSEKLLRSHYENNYTGAVKRLNLIQQQLGQLPADAAPYQTGALKREELIAANSMVLHELYFANLGGDGKASGTVADAIKARYGAVDAWEREFRQTALSLAGGSGWVILAMDAAAHSVHTYWAADHTHGPAGGTPLLVMDMYEHAFHMDYGANARAYVDAFFQNVDWGEVNRRTEAAGSRRP